MDTRLAGKVLGTTVLAAAVTLGVSAQPRNQQPGAGANAAPIRLRAATFTPARGERPALRESLRISEYPPGRRGYYIVQFEGPIEDAWTAALSATGAEILGYIPDFALKVRMSPGDAAQAARVAHVTWVGLFQPAYKLPPDVARGPQVRPYTVRIERGGNLDEAAAAIAATGAQVLQRDGAAFTIAANETQLESVAHVVDVSSIEAFVLRQKHNEFGGNIIGAGVAGAAGYDGSTQTIAVADTGLGGGTAATAHQDVAASRIVNIFNWPGATDFCFESVSNDGPIDVDTGHGTHVATSALGGGNASGVGRGTAPASRLVFQAIEDFVIPSFFCQFLLGLPPGYYLAGIPADVSGLFVQSYGAGARVHSLSWGSASAGAYTADSASTDAFVWNNRDLAITISAGNSGVDANADGVVDTTSINAPGTAKNVITVGASEGDRGADYECDAAASSTCASQGGQNNVFTYGGAFGASFPAQPLRDDPSAGNAQQMAAFSSRGPTADGRIKPDVVAPGTWILSGYSDRYQQFYDPSPNPQTGLYQYKGWGDPRSAKYKYMGGTSMSAPLVAGGAAVVRDYYEKAHAHSASAALVKATLVNSAIDLLDENNDGVDDNAFPIPNIHEGWGRVDLGAATDGTRQFVDESITLTTGGTSSHTLAVDASGLPLRVTLAWTDAPSTSAAAVNLVNDLDLELIAPNGTVYAGNAFLDGYSVPGGAADRTNNLENVYVSTPIAGEWTVVVRGFNVPQGPQPYALVMGRESSPVVILPRVSVAATDNSATEAGATSGAFTFSRSGDVSIALTVNYNVTGTAVAGSDYTALSGTVTFAAGAADAIVTLQPIDDALVESSETVVVSVLPGATYGVRSPASATVNIVSDDQPGDLVMTALTGPTTAVAGTAIVVSDTTRNQGAWPTQGSETGFYLSTNTLLDTADQFLGSRTVPALIAGASHTQSTTLTIPSTAVGTYYVIAKADWNIAVPETNETNNGRSTSSIRIGPDLIVSALTVPASAAPGGSITVSDTTRNDGVQSAGASATAFYLSANSLIDAADVRLGHRTVPELAPTLGHTVSTTTLTIPSDTPVGSYFIIAKADDTALVAEATESNNLRHSTTLRIGADLIISAVSGPTTGGPGATISVTDTTMNQGGSGSSAFVTGFYLSTNYSLDANDVRLGERSVASLGAGVSTTAATNLTIPVTTLPGMYYIIANADDGNAIGEPLENNNMRVTTTQFKVGADLMVVSLGVPLTGGAGGTIALTDNLRNVGGARSVPSEAVFYLSANTTLDGLDVEIARRTIAALDPGMSSAATAVASIPADTLIGTYYVIEVVDPLDIVDEAVETNNSYRGNTVKIGPDLTVISLSAPATVVAGATITVTDTTKNSGGGAVGASTTAYYLSSNVTLEPGDIAVGSRAVPGLSAGGSHAFSGPITIPTTVPAGTYYLIANANEGLAVAETSTTNNVFRYVIRVTQP